MASTRRYGSETWLGLQPAVAGLLTVCFIVLYQSVAMAQPAPLTCSGTNWDRNVPMQFGATRFDRQATNSNNYSNNTNLPWALLMNSNVATVQLHNLPFVTEYGYDYFNIAQANGTTQFTGTIAAAWTTMTPLGSLEKYVNALWHADISNTGTPPIFDMAQFKCNAQQGTLNSFAFGPAGGYAEGLLMGNADVIYFQATQPANSPMQISLEGLATVGSPNFYLYASTNTAFPFMYNYTWASQASYVNQFLSIPASTSQRTIYASVYALTGNGHFSVRVALQPASTLAKAVNVCTAGFSIDTSTQAFANFSQQLQNTSLRMYAASRGNLWINEYDIYQIPTPPKSCPNAADFCAGGNPPNGHGCTICMNLQNDPDGCTVGQTCGSVAGRVAGTTRIANINCPNRYSSAFEGGAFTWSHEWSHNQGIGAEEWYGNQPGDPSFCGHSLLNGPTNSNFWCSDWTHCKDGVVAPNAGEPSCVTGGDNWSHTPSTWFKPDEFNSTEPDTNLINAPNGPAMSAVLVWKKS